MLGICRGAQLVNVLLGGSLYQDLETQLPGAVRHRMEPPYSGVCHTVTLEPSGFLHALLGKDSIGVNSCHHQGICRVAPALRLEASAPDGLAEGPVLPGPPLPDRPCSGTRNSITTRTATAPHCSPPSWAAASWADARIRCGPPAHTEGWRCVPWSKNAGGPFPDEEYLDFWETASAGECTGLMPTPPVSAAQQEAYRALFSMEVSQAEEEEPRRAKE